MIEALIGVMVIVVAVLVFLPGLIQSRKMIQRSQRVETATEVAEAELEHWREATFTGLPAIKASSQSTSQSLSQPNPLPGPSGSVVFTKVDSNLLPTASEYNRRKIAATVNWNDGHGDVGSVVLTSMVVGL